jgi:mono/diheme cytochrome c family protein
MKKRMVILGLAAGCLVLVGLGWAADKSNAKQIARGEYLVKAIGQCGDCHSPMNQRGEFIPGQWLHGKKLEFKSIEPMPVWADTSPNIAGLPGWNRDVAIKFLMTGLAPDDQPARPPMPQYHMERADAEAVVAYLQSLK